MNCISVKSNSLDFRINQLIEDVFKFTLNKNHEFNVGSKVQALIYLEELATTSEKLFIDLELLEHALFERLLLDNPESHIIKPKEFDKNIDLRTTLNECIIYLFECYKDLNQLRTVTSNGAAEWIKVIDDIIKLIIRNSATALKQPDLYSSQDIHQQVYF